MSTTSAFHFRAFLCAAIHFAFCAALASTVLILAVADLFADPSEFTSSRRFAGLHWLLMILSAPMAALFGLWQDCPWAPSTNYLMALAWSVVVGYLISIGWQIAQKIMLRRSVHAV
jgi:hypothetical protein